MSESTELIVIIRPSFKKVCGPDACRAAIYNHILFRLAGKAKSEPDEKVRKGEIFWYASAEDICQDIDEAWCVNKVRKEVKQLVDAGLVGQRHNPVKRWDRRFQYFIGAKEGKKLLEKCKSEGVCLLHIGLNAEVLHLLHMVNAFTKNGACICQKEEMDLPNMANASTKYGRAITKESTKGSTEESQKEDTLGVSTDVSTPSPAPDLSEDVDTLKDAVDGAYEHLTGKSPVDAAMEDSYSLTTQPTTTNSSERKTTHDNSYDIPAGRNPGGAHAHQGQSGREQQDSERDQGHGTGRGVRGSGTDGDSKHPNGRAFCPDGHAHLSHDESARPSTGTQGQEQVTNERRLNETSAQDPATVLNRRGTSQRPGTGVGTSAQDTAPAVVAAAIGSEQARQPKLSQAEFDAAMQKDAKARQQVPHQQNGRNNGRKPTSDTPTKAQLTLQGSEVAKWYAIAASISVRMSGANVRALNTLGEMPGMDEANLTDVLKLLNASKFVKERGVPIGLQELASEDGAWRFDLWLTTVMRNRQDASRANSKSQTTTETDLQRHNREMREKYAPAGAK